MQFLRQNTAITRRFGPFVDATDGSTLETGLTINQADIQLSKAGAAFAQSADSNGGTHDDAGWYSATLTAADTGTAGTLDVQIAATGARPVWAHFMVLPENVYDALVAGRLELM